MSGAKIPKIIDCDRLWTEMVTVVYKLLGKPRVTSFPPPLPKTEGEPAEGEPAQRFSKRL